MTITARFIPHLLIAFLLFAPVAKAEDSTPSYKVKADEYLKAGEYDKALDELKAGVSLYPYDEDLRRELAQTYAQIAQRDLKLTRYSQAANYFAQAREISPGNTEFGLMRGIALYLDKKYDLARAEFEQGGDGVTSLVYLGKISYDTGDLPAAISYWRRAQEKNPKETAITSLIAKAEKELPVESKMDKGYSSMFDLSYDAELPPGLASEVLDALESAYNNVGNDLGLFPSSRIPVLLYTKQDYSSVTAGPDWSGGLYDGKIRLPVGGITKVSTQMRGIIFHEFTHVLIAQITGGNIPTWLNEGLAEIEGRKEWPHSIDLSRIPKEKRVLPLPKLSGSFLSMTTAEAAVAYEQSYSVASFMVSRYGWYAVQTILKNLGERVPIDTAVSKALADYSLDLPGVVREWQESQAQ